ncbi:MAG TPA: hypothetical protein VFE27_10655 [Acidobacteriaceae bacterium]|nr:hypothetical protein [Acidobacteriaceae bacterium]
MDWVKIRANRGCVHFHHGAGGCDLQLRVHGGGAPRFEHDAFHVAGGKPRLLYPQAVVPGGQVGQNVKAASVGEGVAREALRRTHCRHVGADDDRVLGIGH